MELREDALDQAASYEVAAERRVARTLRQRLSTETNLASTVSDHSVTLARFSALLNVACYVSDSGNAGTRRVLGTIMSSLTQFSRPSKFELARAFRDVSRHGACARRLNPRGNAGGATLRDASGVAGEGGSRNE